MSKTIVRSLEFASFGGLDLYTRPINELPQTLVKSGKPVFGTFTGHLKNLDIRGVRRPYGIIPLPTFITNLRIKSRLSLFFNIGEYIGYIEFFDAKVLGYAEVCFWNMTTKQKFVYRAVMGPRKRFVPHKLTTASTSCYKKKRYIRISWDRTHDRISAIFHLHGDNVRPDANAAFLANFSNEFFAEITENRPAPTMRRCSASYITVAPLHGALTIIPQKESPITMEDSEGLSLLDINRTYMRFRSNGEFFTALGYANGKKIQFRLAKGSHDAVNTDLYNDNVLFCDGKFTPLPPVVITHPFGIMEKWIIQDTEGMVDLNFTPYSDNLNKISIFILRTEYHTLYGTFEGALLDAEGNKITLKALPGIAKSYLIRL